MSEKPVVLVTRKLPEAVEARLARDYRARLNAEDSLYTTEELLALAEGADGILPCHTEHLSAGVIEKLPERARHVFVLSAVYGYSHEESSDMLGIAVGTSKAQLHRARRLLAQQLQEQGYEA